jgi:plasmid stabilization system protein ParE
MRAPGAAQRFDQALRAVFAGIRQGAEQFPQHGLIAVENGRPHFHVVRRAVVPRPFPYVVFFYVRRREAIVLAVAHVKRRPGYWTERR